MKRIYLSYAQQDGEAALYIATQLRGRGVDVFVDYERLMTGGNFTRRMGNEIKGRDALVLLQSPQSLNSPLVQAEIRWAHDHNITIIPLVFTATNTLGEFTFLLNSKPIDFTQYAQDKRAQNALIELEQRLRQTNDEEQRITARSASMITEVAALTGHSSWVRSISFAPNGLFLASGSNDNTVCLWDIRTLAESGQGAVVATLDAHTASVWHVMFSPDGGMLASCSNDTTLRLWDVEDALNPYEFIRFTDHYEPVYSVAFSSDMHYLATASYDKSVHLRDITRLRTQGTDQGTVALAHASHVYAVTFSPTTDVREPLYLVTASQDSTIRSWEVERGSIRTMSRVRPHFLIGHTSWVNAITFAPNGTLLASTSKDKTIRLWEMSQRREVAVLTGHTDEVISVAFSPDGRLLASTSKDKSIRLWEVASQREVGVIRGNKNWVNAVAFSPDGRLLATASGDTTIRFWGVPQSVRNGR